MPYKLSKCPHCGKYIDMFKPTGWNDLKEHIGHPVGTCFSCLQRYNTGRKYWKDMDGGARFVVYARVAFSAVFEGIMVGFITLTVLMLLNTKLNWIQSDHGFTIASFTCIILGFVFSTWGNFAQLADLKKLPEPNK